MLSWISNWWEGETIYGPARNAPNGGVGISKLFEQKPMSVIILNEPELKEKISGLQHVETEDKSSKSGDLENNLFSGIEGVNDPKQFLQSVRSKRGTNIKRGDSLADHFRKLRDRRLYEARMQKIINDPRLRREHKLEVNEYLGIVEEEESVTITSPEEDYDTFIEV